MTEPTNQTEVTLRWLNARTVLTVVLVSAGVSLCVGLVTTLLVASQANSALRDEQVRADAALRAEQAKVARLSRINGINGCDGTNLLRGDARLLINGLKPAPPNPRRLSDWLLRVRNCPATYDSGRIVVASREAEYRYLIALAHRHRVALRVAGSRVTLIPMQ